MSWWWWLGLAVATIACLFVVGSVLLIIGAIIAAYWNRLRAEARRVTIPLADLGDFTSTDGKNWSGEVRGLSILFTTDNEPPSSTQIEAFRSLLDDLPRLVRLSNDYLKGHDEGILDPDSQREFGVVGVLFLDRLRFTVDMEHPDDPGGWYYVVFENGKPSWSGRDD